MATIYYSDYENSADESGREELDNVARVDSMHANDPPPRDEGGTASASSSSDETEDTLVSASRAYQLEMYEESLKGNIIVAMDTGTGKTRVALLRISAELERSPPDKVVWFLAPTVFLCEQQSTVISEQIRGVQAKILTGQSGVDTWKSQSIWDDVLFNVRVVVATHQVLLDALKHGFVKLESISLIVFDEAHGCVKENAGRRIMMEIYHPAKANGQPCPAILGLTASPVQGKKLDGLEELERTLDATCKTPKRHRDDLIAHTKLPTTHKHLCGSGIESSAAVGENLLRLRKIGQANAIQPPSPAEAQNHFGHELTEETIKWTWSFVKSFCRRSEAMCEELGPWAAEYYVHKVIQRCIKASKRALAEHKERYLIFILQQVAAVRPIDPQEDRNHDAFLAGLSAKVKRLAEILRAYKGDRPTGIVFVKEKPMAAVLARLVSVHPRLQPRFCAEHVVGMSQTNGDRFDSILYLAPKDGRKPLRRFRVKKLNLLVATNVIEEGIDVPACNLVVCIDELTNLKAFIQRRGRAREHNSELHLLASSEAWRALSHSWEDLEKKVKRIVEDDLREIQELSNLESNSELNDCLLEPLHVESTNARLSAKDAKQHLQHFCATTSSTTFVDWRPAYFMHADEKTGKLRAEVQLPITVPSHLRCAHSNCSWRTEADACADAAFQAYKNLYRGGLLTDNLLPPQSSPDRSIEERPGVVVVRSRYRPWAKLAQKWASLSDSSVTPTKSIYKHSIRVANSYGSDLCEADIVLPFALPEIKPFEMFWTAHSSRPWTVSISKARNEPLGSGPGNYQLGDDHTEVLLTAAYGHRWPISDRHRLVRFVCVDERLSKEQIGSRVFNPRDFSNAELLSSHHLACLIRDPFQTPYFYQESLESKPARRLVRKPYKGFDEAPEDVAHVAVRQWPSIVGFLHKTTNAETEEKESRTVENGASPNTPTAASAKPYQRVLPATACTVDSLPMAYVQFGALIPPLTQVLEVFLVADELLSSTRLNQLSIDDVSLIATAISTPAARLPTNYECLEFIGDSILKVCATVNCAAHFPDAPEGHLSLYKDRLVSNSRLSRAAIKFGLDQYIISKQWSVKMWKTDCETTSAPLSGDANESDDAIAVVRGSYNSPQKTGSGLEMSTKTLADVVEAVIGAYYTDGGMRSALHCISLFQPDTKWLPLSLGRDNLYKKALVEPPWLPPPALEELLGYSFTKKSLLVEAMTHASTPGDQKSGCMERLEFIGDAILDYVVVQKLMAVKPPLAHYKMHLLRTVLVNAGFLGFTTMMFSVSEMATKVAPDGSAQKTEIRRPLWKFMKHGASRDMGIALRATALRFATLKERILGALWRGRTYPWALLAQLRLEKLFSDLLEAVIGAIWVDSGSEEAVEALLERIGLLPYLRLALDEDIHLLHPKEELGKISGNAKITYRVTRATQDLHDTQKKKRGPRKSSQDGESDRGDGVDENSDDDDDDDEDALGDDADSNADIYTCRLSIDGSCVAEIDDGVSREDAETRAAEFAVKALKERD